MPTQLDEQKLADVEASLSSIHRNHFRLALVVGQPGAGKTRLLRALSQTGGRPMLNVNLEISQRLMEHPRAERPRLVPRFLSDIVREAGSQTVLLDNCEMLFDAELGLSPLQLLQSLSRNRTLVVAWQGTYIASTLTYAAPGHPEERSYALGPQDALIFSLD